MTKSLNKEFATTLRTLADIFEENPVLKLPYGNSPLGTVFPSTKTELQLWLRIFVSRGYNFSASNMDNGKSIQIVATIGCSAISLYFAKTIFGAPELSESSIKVAKYAIPEEILSHVKESERTALTSLLIST